MQFIQGLHQLSNEQKREVASAIRQAFAVYQAYGPSVLGFMQEQAGVYDPNLLGILSAVLEKKYTTWKELTIWLREQEYADDLVHISISDPDMQKSLADKYVVDAYDEVGLLAKGKGSIYKRTLTQDVNTLLQ